MRVSDHQFLHEVRSGKHSQHRDTKHDGLSIGNSKDRQFSVALRLSVEIDRVRGRRGCVRRGRAVEDVIYKDESSIN